MAARRPTAGSTTATVREADDVALIERIEVLEDELKARTEERERLKTELMVAQGWVRELATWVEENAPPVGAVARDRSRRGEKPLGSFGIPLPSTPAVEWRAVTTAGAAVVAPWLVLALVVYAALAVL